jgi:hypothetical protein
MSVDANNEMRNAKCADIAFELAWIMFKEMAIERPGFTGPVLIKDSKTGVSQDGWTHNFYGAGEYLADVLVKLGVLSEVKNGQFVPLMTLDECRTTDFTRFELFDCYVECMRAMGELLDWEFDSKDEVATILLKRFSPSFQSSISEKDDMFAPFQDGFVVFKRERYEQKVMKRWREMSYQGLVGKAFRSS